MKKFIYKYLLLQEYTFSLRNIDKVSIFVRMYDTQFTNTTHYIFYLYFNNTISIKIQNNNRNNIFTPMLEEFTLINNILISFNRKSGNAFYLNQCTPGSLRNMCRVFFIKKNSDVI